MYKYLYDTILRLYYTKNASLGIGLFRCLYGLVTLQEICFLLYFQHLIFDPIPYIDVALPMVGFFLGLWAVVACCVCIGYRCQLAIISNYIFWIVFINFTPMQRDFDGGFDAFMVGANFLMIFMPIDKSLAIDTLRKKLQTPFKHYSHFSKQDVSILAYTIPVTICLGFLYFDSALHKLFAEHWRNGLGVWLPASMPYYISPINMSALLNNEFLQKTMGYMVFVFQFSFIFGVHNARLRPLFFILGISLHIGIIVTLNIYPFGVGMLIFYCLVMPFAWYRKLAVWVVAKSPTLIVFYDEQCPLCCRTILTLNHFDIFKTIDFKGVQTHATQYPVLHTIQSSTLLKDLYALDKNNNLYTGVNSYLQILIKMRYPALVAYLFKLPIIYQISDRIYRKIADRRVRVSCASSVGRCISTSPNSTHLSLYDSLFTPQSDKQATYAIHKISKTLLFILLLQLNSSIHYGLFYRLGLLNHASAITHSVIAISNSIILGSGSFLGITPHALYLHDHFDGYNHLIAITYQDTQGNETWLPLVSPEGRMESPNWGRVHSMWANVAVTANIEQRRLSKFIMKTSAFWGTKLGLNLQTTLFSIKSKKISMPSYWVKDLLGANLSGVWQNIGEAKWHKKSFIVEYTSPSIYAKK